MAKARRGLLVRMLDWLAGEPAPRPAPPRPTPPRPTPPHRRPTGLAPAPPVLRTSLERAMHAEAVLQGRVSSVVKGGLLVDIGYDVRAFLPGSQIDIKRVPDFSAYVGRTIQVRIIEIIEVDRRTTEVVLSRRRILEEERRQRAASRPRPRSEQPPATERDTPVENDAPTDADDWRPTAVRAGGGRLVVDLSSVGDVDEVRKIVTRRVEVEATRGVSEILVRMQQDQKRELRSLISSGALDAVDPRRSRQVQDGLMLVLVQREPENRSHE